MKLNTTLRPMLKFNPTRCDDLYDPQGLREQNVQPEGPAVMGVASASASVIGQPMGDVGALVKSASPATTAAPTTTSRPKLKHYARHDWAKVIRLSTQFYAAQESGKLREDNPVSWRMSSHESDGRPCGMDLSGGYYDSGDFMKYTFPMAWTMTVLAWSAMEHESVLKEVGVWEQYVQDKVSLSHRLLESYDKILIITKHKIREKGSNLEIDLRQLGSPDSVEVMVEETEK